MPPDLTTKTPARRQAESDLESVRELTSDQTLTSAMIYALLAIEEQLQILNGGDPR